MAENASPDASESMLVAGQPSTPTFRNQASMPHNIVIHRDGQDPVFEDRIIERADSLTYRITRSPRANTSSSANCSRI